MGGPLAGTRVVEVASYITGPYAGLLLADLGADVIKVEDPRTGDPFRAWGGGLYSPHFVAFNRSKRSLTLDLKEPDAVAAFLRLAGTADVVIENFRPGVADRLGISYEHLRPLNPRLVYCSISGMGSSGPYASRPSFDTVGQALSGLLSLLTDPADPQPVGPAFSDSLTGLFAAYGVLAALQARERTGAGQLVETSMLSATLGFLLEPFGIYFGHGEVPGPATRQAIAQVYAFTCADGMVLAMHLSSPPKFWEGLVTSVGRPDMLQDPRFQQREQRIKHYQAIKAELAPIFRTRDRENWLRALQAADVPCAPVYSIDEVLNDPQVRHEGLEQRVEHPVEGAVRLLGLPVKLHGTPLDGSVAPPTLGEHTHALLEELGYGPSEIERLHPRGPAEPLLFHGWRVGR